MAKTEEYQSYPEPVARRSGMKVSWNYYTDKALAEECAKAAKANAVLAAQQGYDFGYQSPGQIEVIAVGQYAGTYKVCLP